MRQSEWGVKGLAGAELTDRSYWLVLSFLYMSYRGDSLTGRRTIVRSGNGIAL